MIRAPVAYDPFRHSRAALARRATVLARLERHGHLRPAARARAAAAPLGVRPGGPGAARAPWFVGWVLDQLLDPADHRFDALGTSRRARTARVFTGGLRIATTVDLAAQAAAERAVAAVVGRRGGGPSGALAAVEPGTGAVRAMVDGRSWEDRRFGRVNLATGAGGGGRPAGSAFKTFALVTALERGIPPEALFDAPDRLVIGRGGRPAWRVANYEGHGYGHATLRSATALSINTVYAELLVRLGGGDADRGAAAMAGTAARLGVASRLRAVPSAVLGTNEVTPLEMAVAYATLAAGGAGRGRPGRGAGCLPNRFTPAAQVASVVYLRAAAPTRTCRGPAGPLAGVVPAVVGVPMARAAGWLEAAGLSLAQRLRPDAGVPPGTVPAQSPAGGAARPPGTPVTLTVAVDAQGAGGLGVTLVPEVLGQPEPAARRLLDPAGLAAEVLAGCDDDPARAAAEPGRVWRSGPAPGAQAPVGGRVRLWVNPGSCPARPPPPRPGPAGRPPPPPPGGTARRSRAAAPGGPSRAARGGGGVAGDQGPPGAVGGGGDPDPAGPGHLVVGDGPAGTEQHRGPVQGQAVGPPGQPEGRAQAGRPPGQVAGAAGRAPGPHALDAADRLAGPQQHRLGGPLGGADHVGAPVHPVGEVEVEAAGWAEHDRVAGAGAAVGVAGRVQAGPVVGLGLDQPDRAGPLRGLVDQQPPEQVAGHLQQRPQVELGGQRLQGARGQRPLGRGGVDSRRRALRRWATLPIRGPRHRWAGLRRGRVAVAIHAHRPTLIVPAGPWPGSGAARPWAGC
jgi:Penicillin binding protein transpeptidase domain/PASTA domain